MQLRITWRKGWAWACGTDPGGKRVKRALKTQDPRRAEELRADLESRLWKAELYGTETVITFDEAALAYAEDGGDATHLVKITEQLHGMKLQDITPLIVRDAARKAFPTGSNGTRNRQGITPARAVINFAHSQGWCPPIKVKSFPVEKPKRKAVGHDYLVRLRPHLPKHLFALMLFLQSTGRRIGEAIELRPEHVDLDAGTVHIERTKNGDPAIAFIVPVLADILRDLEPINGRVFGYNKRNSVYSTLKRACKKAGVEYLGTHQPGRHSFATALDKAGWNARAIADAGGWVSALG